MAFNPNEMIIDRVRYVTFNDLDGKQQFMLTQIEDPSLNCTAEGEDVVDAVGALITTLYRSKQAEFTASNSLFSLNLAAAQLGSEKEVASAGNEIEVFKYEFIPVADGATTVDLAETPVEGSVQYIYAVENGVSTAAYKLGAGEATANEFTINGKTITLPTLSEGEKLSKIFVEYKYKSENAVRVVNSASDFPEVGTAHIYVIFKDVCTEEVIAGQIIFNKAKLDPSSVELALTATGKHAFTLKAFKDYCSEDEELYTIIVTQ